MSHEIMYQFQVVDEMLSCQVNIFLKRDFARVYKDSNVNKFHVRLGMQRL